MASSARLVFSGRAAGSFHFMQVLQCTPDSNDFQSLCSGQWSRPGGWRMMHWSGLLTWYAAQPPTTTFIFLPYRLWADRAEARVHPKVPLLSNPAGSSIKPVLTGTKSSNNHQPHPAPASSHFSQSLIKSKNVLSCQTDVEDRKLVSRRNHIFEITICQNWSEPGRHSVLCVQTWAQCFPGPKYPFKSFVRNWPRWVLTSSSRVSTQFWMYQGSTLIL